MAYWQIMGHKWYTDIPYRQSCMLCCTVHSQLFIHCLSTTLNIWAYTLNVWTYPCNVWANSCIPTKESSLFTLPHVHIIMWLTTSMTVDWARKESEALLGHAYIGSQGDCQHSVMYMCILPYTLLFKLTLPYCLPLMNNLYIVCNLLEDEGQIKNLCNIKSIKFPIL